MTGQRGKRAVSEPVMPPSAVRRITSLPTYGGGKELQRSGSRAMGTGRRETPNACSTSQHEIKNSRRGVSSEAHSSTRLDAKDVSSGPSSNVVSTGNFPASSPKHKSVTSSHPSSQLVPKREVHTHHCIRDGHRFELLTLNKPSTSEGRGGVKTENRIAARKYKCGKCQGRIDETRILMCKVPVCRVMICGECKKEWEVLNKGWLRRD